MNTAIGAGGAGEGGYRGASVDYGGLTLGRIAHPYVHVVGAIALVEGAQLLLWELSTEGRWTTVMLVIGFDVLAAFCEVACNHVMVGEEGEGYLAILGYRSRADNVTFAH